MPTPLQSLVGRTLGGYQVLSELGRGGMSVVFRAKDKPPLNREVALKVLKPELLSDPETVERFLAGARAEAELQHPNIVTIYGVGQDKGLHFIVMELVEGQPLSDVLQEGRPLPVARRQHILAQVADAIDFAHEQRMVHRDIKPGNVMIGAHDHATLLDFGLVRVLDNRAHTQVGTIMGTPEYMSPEQVRGEPVGPPTDIYSLGIVAYRMITGIVPFSAEHSAAVLHKQAYEPPQPPRVVRPSVSRQVEIAVLRALEKDAALRWRSARAFVDAMGTTAKPAARATDGPPVVVRAPVAESSTKSRSAMNPAAATVLLTPSNGPASQTATKSGRPMNATAPLLAASAGLIVIALTVIPSVRRQPVAVGTSVRAITPTLEVDPEGESTRTDLNELDPELTLIASKVQYWSWDESNHDLAFGEHVRLSPGTSIRVGESGHAQLEWPEHVRSDLYGGTVLGIVKGEPAHASVLLDQDAGTVRYRMGVGERSRAATIFANGIAILAAGGSADIVVSFIPSNDAATVVVALDGDVSLVRNSHVVTLSKGDAAVVTANGTISTPLAIDGVDVKAWLDSRAWGTEEESFAAVVDRCRMESADVSLRQRPDYGASASSGVTVVDGATVVVLERNTYATWIKARTLNGSQEGWVPAYALDCLVPPGTTLKRTASAEAPQEASPLLWPTWTPTR